jgi:Protein of unknown function (DUF2891)
MRGALTADLASLFARIALGNVTREFPNKLDHVLTGAADAKAPRALHPIFYGAFDWHSCVHGYWLLARLIRGFPELPEAPAIRRTIDEHFTAANAKAELDYLNRPESRGFERPYGLAWLLMLASELAHHDSAQGRRWFEALSALTHECATRLRDYLIAAKYPVRAGVHSNSAFALILAMDYAAACGNDAMLAALRQKSRAWFGGDADCPAWEPDGEDFLSPALTEALCMAHALAAADFAAWLARFLPRLAAREPANLFRPAIVSDRTDGKIVHLDGLNLSRAWCWKSLAGTFAAADPRREIAHAAAGAHLDASLPHVADDYAGCHWLASFALLALEA